MYTFGYQTIEYIRQGVLKPSKKCFVGISNQVVDIYLFNHYKFKNNLLFVQYFMAVDKNVVYEKQYLSVTKVENPSTNSFE